MEIIITKRIVPKNWMMSIKAEYNAWHMVGAELMLVPFFFFFVIGDPLKNMHGVGE